MKYSWCTMLYQSLPHSKVIQLYMESKILHKWIYLQNKNRLTDTENRLAVANGSCILILYLLLLISIKTHSESHFPVAISNSISITKCVTQQGPMGPFWDRSPAPCPLPAYKKTFSQRINLIREMRICMNEGKQSNKTN